MKTNQQQLEEHQKRDKQQQQPKICRQCNEFQTQKNPFRGNSQQEWDICYECFNPQIQPILEGVYLGNEDAAMDLEIIQKYQIRAICVCGYLERPFVSKKMSGPFQDICYVKYDIGDFYDQKIIQYFDPNFLWIQQRLKQGRNVLIHCAGGVSRSASFTIAYLMKKYNMQYNDAFEFVKKRRSVINPNTGFREQLKKYSQRLRQLSKDKQVSEIFKKCEQRIQNNEEFQNQSKI